MPTHKNKANLSAPKLRKAPTGIQGLDEITGGGLPKGRTSLICGSPGCGKTLLAMELLARGATESGEPGLFVSFEETPEEIIENTASVGFDLPKLIADKKVLIEYIYIERNEIEETGEYNLEGLFVRLAHAAKEIKAKRVALDTIEALFSGLSDTAVLRAEIRRLFRWLKDRGLTAIVTAEQGDGALTRHGLEEYVSDCVILLDHRVNDELSTRRLRVVKYRGSRHGANEYPFLIDDQGFSVLPITSLGLNHAAPKERISAGVPGLDEMLGGRGYYRGSTILVSGTAGTGKTSIAAHFVDAACRRGERSLYFAYEESTAQLIRNMRSIGLDLEQWVKKGLLQLYSERPTLSGLEMHLMVAHKLVREFKPKIVVVDPITDLTSIGLQNEVHSMVTRLIDMLKLSRTTALFTSLTTGGNPIEQSEVGISSLIDTWIVLTDIEEGRERSRGVQILKSRGMAHSNQFREFLFSKKGINLVDVYLGPSGMLTGSARVAQAAREKAEETIRQDEGRRKQWVIEYKRRALQAQIDTLQAELESEQSEIDKMTEGERRFGAQNTIRRAAMAQSRSIGKTSSGSAQKEKS